MSVPDPETIATIVGGIVVGLGVGGGALVTYFKSSRRLSKDTPAFSIGGALQSYDQTERMISATEEVAKQVKRIADVMTDKQSAGIQDALAELGKKIDGVRPSRRSRSGSAG